MARNQSTVEGDGEDVHYYRSTIGSLSVVVGDPDPTKGNVAHPTVDFVPYFEQKRGVEGTFKVGYLKTDNGSAIKKMMDDTNVTEITKEEYEDATTEVFDESGTQIGGVRAPL